MSSEAAQILVVDDDAAVCWALEQALAGPDRQVTVCASAELAWKHLKRQPPDLVLTDIRLSGMDGLALLQQVKLRHPLLPVVVMTAQGSMESALSAVRQGAFDYLAKPLDLARLRAVVEHALGTTRIAAAASPGAAVEADGLVGSAPVMQEVYRRIASAAGNDLSVLVQGPTGSGKELVARALHRHGPRSGAPFVAVNCGALPDHLVESELFGHEAGAFTDARARKMGRIEAAQGGTLFLDEVAELPPHTQAKLLRFLEDQRFVRLGGVEEIQASVRVISATHRDVDALVAAGQFRSDLAYRLRVITIRMPALSEHAEDIPALVALVLSRVASRLGRHLQLAETAMARLRTYTWPGNVRELKHVLEEAAALATGGVIGQEHVHLGLEAPQMLGGDLDHLLRREADGLLVRAPGQAHAQLMERCERVLVEAALAQTQGNQLRAAELLGINRITLKKRMDALELSAGNEASG